MKPGASAQQHLHKYMVYQPQVTPDHDFWRKLTTPDFGMSISFRASEPPGIRSLEGIVLRWGLETDIMNSDLYTSKVRWHAAMVAAQIEQDWPNWHSACCLLATCSLERHTC
jgi:hypothetical protein